VTEAEKWANCRRIKTQSIKRIETGPLQINSDAPGYFIRGHDALKLSDLPETLEEIFERYNVPFSERAQVMSGVGVLSRVPECVMIDDTEEGKALPVV
jgi:hypothetical protein